jgi:hypothetical protein
MTTFTMCGLRALMRCNQLRIAIFSVFIKPLDTPRVYFFTPPLLGGNATMGRTKLVQVGWQLIYIAA